MESPSTQSLRQLIRRIEDQAKPADPKLANYLLALNSEVDSLDQKIGKQADLVLEYEDAYTKLTSPANRIGILINHLDEGRFLVALGDTEFVTFADPSIEPESLLVGSRVALNDAYAIVGLVATPPTGPLIKVSEVLDDLRLRVNSDAQGQQGRLVLRSEELRDVKIQQGDELRLDATGRIAVEHFGQREVRDYFVEEVEEIPWDKIGGQEAAIATIRESIEHPMLHPELYRKFDKKPIKGILLYGPPGCGKTLIGKAIAYNLAKEYSERVGHEVKEYFMHISGPKVLNMWLGETERMVREIFQVARERAKEGRLVVIFMDEAESILRTRSSGRWLNISNTVVPQFCAEMDGLVSLENVVLVITTNRPDYIDPAILRPERIDRKVKISRPDKEATRSILSIYLHQDLPLDPDLVKEYDGEESCARKALIESTLAYLWRESRESEFLTISLRNGSFETLHYHDLLSGALIKSVVDRAKDMAIRRAIDQMVNEVGLRQSDMVEAIDAEYRENEIFPKNDQIEDWLKLIDIEPEFVVDVKPTRTASQPRKNRHDVV
ncbi:MAG: AAA family ATPase [Armatimonadetes bacterium]|nr:AAA family ATPase [Armatimonadota bacterium]